MEATHRWSHRTPPRLCFFTWGSSKTLWQEVNLWSSQKNCLSQGWMVSARLGSFSSLTKAKDTIQNHYRCFPGGPDHLSLRPIMTLDTGTELLFTRFMWCDAEEGRVPLCETTKDGLVGFSPSFSAFSPFPSWRKAASPRHINAHQRPQSGRLAAGYRQAGEEKVECYRRHSRMWPCFRKYPIGLINGLMGDWHPDPSTPGSGGQYFFVWGNIWDIRRAS